MSWDDRVDADGKADVIAASIEFAALDAMIREAHPQIGDIRVCPCGCGREQHYTGAEHGWCHDAKAGA